jgi:hypothetical protein
MLSIDEDGRALLINKARRALLHHFSFKGSVQAAAFSPSGEHVAVAVGKLLQVRGARGARGALPAGGVLLLAAAGPACLAAAAARQAAGARPPPAALPPAACRHRSTPPHPAAAAAAAAAAAPAAGVAHAEL